ncbi:MAG: hypothetical protein ACLFPT_23440, partial [Ralstonia sp.]
MLSAEALKEIDRAVAKYPADQKQSAVMAALAVWIGLTGGQTRVAFGGMFVDDAFARFSKVAILLSAATVLVMSQDYMSRRGILRFEYPVLVALASVGMIMMVSAGDLMSLY